MPRKPILVQLSDELIGRLDRLGEAQNRSRSAVVRDAVEQYVTRTSEEIKDRLLAEAYRRKPDDDEFDAWAGESVRALLDEESW